MSNHRCAVQYSYKLKKNTTSVVICTQCSNKSKLKNVMLDLRQRLRPTSPIFSLKLSISYFLYINSLIIIIYQIILNDVQENSLSYQNNLNFKKVIVSKSKLFLFIFFIHLYYQRFHF